jgi:uncharacterized glyoxalase superfamily protein PhnB
MPIPETAQPRTISSEVTVAVDAQTAFSIFTDEIDLWWVRGPINFYDAARAIAMRCEPGVGGRLLEVYDDSTGDALELGRITVWQPGDRLAWTSSVDDVEVEVRFEPVSSGTRVAVIATIPAGGTDSGGTAWVRVTPGWLGAWAARRDTVPHVPSDLARIGLAVYYAKPVAAAHWLAAAFGFESELELADDATDSESGDGGHTWIELRAGNCSLMLFKLDGDRPEGAAVTHVPWVYVDDLDTHFERAQAQGATIVSGIRQHGYRAYEAADLEGNKWLFAQARPTMR